MLCHWDIGRQVYAYALYNGEMKKQWEITSSLVDAVVDCILLQRLRATTIDETVWAKAVADAKGSRHVDVRRIEHAISASGKRPAFRRGKPQIACLPLNW